MPLTDQDMEIINKIAAPKTVFERLTALETENEHLRQKMVLLLDSGTELHSRQAALLELKATQDRVLSRLQELQVPNTAFEKRVLAGFEEIEKKTNESNNLVAGRVSALESRLEALEKQAQTQSQTTQEIKKQLEGLVHDFEQAQTQSTQTKNGLAALEQAISSTAQTSDVEAMQTVVKRLEAQQKACAEALNHLQKMLGV